MNTKLLLLIVSLCPLLAMAQGCDVSTQSQSPSIPEVDSHTCYQYQGMPADAIDWSCSNQSKETLATSKHKVEQCAEHHKASCQAKLTQETLANPKAISDDNSGKSLHIPDNAQITTYYYSAENLQQARVDCEKGGGRWKVNE